MNKSLESISSIVEKYESGQWQSIDNLRILLRELSCEVYKLTKINIDSYKKHNGIMFNHQGAVSRALIEADEQVPELRDTRKIILAANRVIDSMRSEISIIKFDNK